MGYGHIDFTNLFMGINSKNPQAFKISDDGEEVESFSRDLIFMDPNLSNIFTKDGHKQMIKNLMVSQTSNKS